MDFIAGSCFLLFILSVIYLRLTDRQKDKKQGYQPTGKVLYYNPPNRGSGVNKSKTRRNIGLDRRIYDRNN